MFISQRREATAPSSTLTNHRTRLKGAVRAIMNGLLGVGPFPYTLVANDPPPTEMEREINAWRLVE